MANQHRPTFKTRNIRELIRRVDNVNGKPARTYHTPYRWSRGPRRADQILDTPGPDVSVHQQGDL